jgi:hypothetical protein
VKQLLISGRLVAALLRGQFSQLWKAGRLPFAKRKGEMLAAVGEKLGNLHSHMCAQLPTGWTVLYQSFCERLREFAGDLAAEPLPPLVVQASACPPKSNPLKSRNT